MNAPRKELIRLQRKLGIRGKDKAALKLDKKSSRGMIYENEELRLRTININAEVAEGQSSIRKLRSENDRLKREIWSLKDNYDKLKRKYKKRDEVKYSSDHHHHGACGISYSNSEDSCDSCDTCREEYEVNPEIYCGYNVSEVCTDECCMAGKELCITTCDTTTTPTSSSLTNTPNELKPHSSDYTFDHLSVVSEENFTNSDGANSMVEPGTSTSPPTQTQTMSLLIHPLSVQMPNDQPLTPLTPVELIASQLNDLHNAVPPLSYFENIANERMQDHPTTTSNGWDFNVKSPFQIVSLSPSNTNVPAIITSPVVVTPVLQTGSQNIITSPKTLPQSQSSPKNFFSTLKPRPLPVTSPPLSVTSPPLPVYPQEVVMSTPSQSTEYIEPIYAQVKKVGRTSQEQIPSSNSDSNGINLRGILNDIESLSQDIMKMQFNRKLSIEAKSLENVMSSSELPDTDKPYKSEINLLITNPGDDSPPPNVPEPMQPIYPFQYGFERFEVPVQSIPYVALAQPPQIPQLPQLPLQEPIYTAVATPSVTPTLPLQPANGDQPPIVQMRSMSAEAKRNLFKNRSNDSTTDLGKTEDPQHHSSGNGESSSGSEMTNSPSSIKTAIIRRPSFRHVSIVDEGSTPPGQPQPPINTSQQSISNSPHSSQRRNSITPGTPPSQAHSNSNNSNNHGHHHRHNHHPHPHHHTHIQHHRKMSQDSKCSNILGGSLSGGLIEGCSKTPAKTQHHNSRRHSDGTVTLHGRKDAQTYSIHSDRNSFANCSNVGSASSTSSISSLKSNRSNFSGVSYSTRSNRRKLSVNSTAQTAKIPWCGCWGNGCL
ncbi:hypothetical protein ACFFRR_007978 [Megaselia abdita]